MQRGWLEMEARILLLPGDGVGPEVTAAAAEVLREVADIGGHRLSFDRAAIGGEAIDRTGEALPESTLEACAEADALLLGAVGGPRWSDPGAAVRPEQGLLALRSHFELFANLRPIPVFPALRQLAPLDPARLEGVDLLFVRELTGGLYFGPRQEQGEGDTAWDTLLYSVAEVERVARVAFHAARKRRGRLASVDKANVLASMRLWRRVIERLAPEYPEVVVEHVLVDAAAMRLLREPASFDVVVTGNLFGDILSDEASMLSGSLGLLPSASIGSGSLGLYEPVHGSAPDIAGQGIANPTGAILSAALLLRHSLGLEEEAAAIERAVALAFEGGVRTADLLAPSTPRVEAVSTEQMTREICRQLHQQVVAVS